MKKTFCKKRLFFVKKVKIEMEDVVKYYRNIIQNSTEKILLLNKNGDILYMNIACEKFFHCKLKEQKTFNIIDFCYQTKGKVKTYLNEVKRGTREESLCCKTYFNLKESFKVELDLYGMYDRQREIIVMTLKSKVQDDRIEEIINNHAMYPVIVLDKDFNVLRWNKSAEDFFGYSEEEVRTKEIKFLAPDNRQEEYALLRKHLRHCGSLKNYETFRYHKNRSLLPVAVFSNALKDENGEITGYITIYKERVDNHKEHVVKKVETEEIEETEEIKQMQQIQQDISNEKVVVSRKKFVNKAVLCIDNNPIFQSVLERLLEERACKYIAAYSGASAIELLRTQAIDLIIVEPKLCDMQGFEFAEQICQNPDYQKIPVLVITEYPKEYAIYTNDQWNIKKIILKPIHLQEFNSALEDLAREKE